MGLAKRFSEFSNRFPNYPFAYQNIQIGRDMDSYNEREIHEGRWRQLKRALTILVGVLEVRRDSCVGEAKGLRGFSCD